MFTGVTALLFRSLRMDARSWLNHLTRFGLMAAIYIALCVALGISTRFGAPGLRFFRTVVYLNSIFLTLLGIGFFSTTITEEKEEGTLGLIQMAGIGPLGLLMGKLGGRLIQALLLILVQYPFTLLAVTMGGVSMAQVQAVYVGLIGYMLMIAGAGLLCSTIASNSRRAATLLVIGLAAYVMAPFLLRELWRNLLLNRTGPQSILARGVQMFFEASLFVQIEPLLVSGFGDSPWSVQAISNALLGLVCFGTAWCCFGLATRSPESEAVSRGTLSRSKSGLARSFSPGRVWQNPFLWKDFHFVSGGLSLRLIRMISYTVLFFVSWGLAKLWGFGGWGSGMTRIIGVYQFFALCALSWETAMLAARCLQDEIRGQSLGSLMMLPRSTSEIFYSKLLGAMLGAYPGFIALAIACVIGLENTVEFLDLDDPGPFILAHLLLVPHLAAVFALWVRWGAVPLAIGTMVGFFAMWIAIAEVMLGMRDHHFNVIGLGVLALCAACHVVVLVRLRHVAESA